MYQNTHSYECMKTQITYAHTCATAHRRNMTAYSWPSHCARYLHTIEDQKNASENEGAIRYNSMIPTVVLCLCPSNQI